MNKKTFFAKQSGGAERRGMDWNWERDEPIYKNETSLLPERGRWMVYVGGLWKDGCLARTIWSGNNNKNRFVNTGYHVAEIFCASSRICSKKRVVASSFVRFASSAASFISCESTASDGSSILVNRYVSIVGFITMMFLFSGAKVRKLFENESSNNEIN